MSEDLFFLKKLPKKKIFQNVSRPTNYIKQNFVQKNCIDQTFKMFKSSAEMNRNLKSADSDWTIFDQI